MAKMAANDMVDNEDPDLKGSKKLGKSGDRSMNNSQSQDLRDRLDGNGQELNELDADGNMIDNLARCKNVARKINKVIITKCPILKRIKKKIVRFSRRSLQRFRNSDLYASQN